MRMSSPMKIFLWRILGLWAGPGFLFFMPGAYAQPISCADTLRTIQYTSMAFGPATEATSLTAIGTSDGGELYYFNREVAGADSLVLFRTDMSGNVIWSKEVNETEPTYGWFFSHAIELGNGGFVLSGGLAYGGNNSGPALSSILMLDAHGNVLWQHQYDNLGIAGTSLRGSLAKKARGQSCWYGRRAGGGP